MEYKIIQAISATHLEIQVNREITQQWEPLGNVTTLFTDDGEVTFFQAMIKKGNKK